MASDSVRRWTAVGVLVLSSALNYLDRMVLMALAPTIQTEFSLSREQFGQLVAAFSIVYALSSPAMGLLIDRLGLRWGTALLVTLWSCAGIATGFAGTYAGLLICRAMLGFAEAGGVPATGKGFALYLAPEHRAIGTALNQVGLTVGSMGAPIVTEWLDPLFGWRSAFILSGALGFIWIPFWFLATRTAPPVASDTPAPQSAGMMLHDRRFQMLVIANILAMTIYSLWTTWTTVFLVTHYGLSREEANLDFAWIPPIFMTAGGLFGGWLALHLIRKGAGVIEARIRISAGAAVLAASTAAAALMPNGALATAAICLSVAATTCLSVNYYAIPLDLFGAGRAGFAVSMLTGSFGLMQAILSPLIGRWSDTFGWQPVCALVAVLPFCSVLLLRMAFRRS
jgi:ACS family hexuronate transporter-like MFS transporter